MFETSSEAVSSSYFSLKVPISRFISAPDMFPSTLLEEHKSPFIQSTLTGTVQSPGKRHFADLDCQPGSLSSSSLDMLVGRLTISSISHTAVSWFKIPFAKAAKMLEATTYARALDEEKFSSESDLSLDGAKLKS